MRNCERVLQLMSLIMTDMCEKQIMDETLSHSWDIFLLHLLWTRVKLFHKYLDFKRYV